MTSWVSVFIYFQNNQRLSSSQSSQPLSTPVVSITTPSLPHQSLIYSGVSAAYNNGIWWPLSFVLCSDWTFLKVFACENDLSFFSELTLYEEQVLYVFCEDYQIYLCFGLKTKWRDNVDKDRKIICPLAEDPQHVQYFLVLFLALVNESETV